jgi:ribosomal protein S27E
VLCRLLFVYSISSFILLDCRNCVLLYRTPSVFTQCHACGEVFSTPSSLGGYFLVSQFCFWRRVVDLPVQYGLGKARGTRPNREAHNMETNLYRASAEQDQQRNQTALALRAGTMSRRRAACARSRASSCAIFVFSSSSCVTCRHETGTAAVDPLQVLESCNAFTVER